MKKTLILLSLFAVVMVTAVYAVEPPEEITIDAAMDKKTAVTFPHAQHAKELVDSCTACHHKDEGLSLEADMTPQACSDCHLDPEGDVPGMREMSLKKNPFHMMCIDCHKAEGAGPKTCNECHPK